MGIAISWWTQYLLKINAQLTKWTDKNVTIDVALCSFLAAPPALPNTPCENVWGQRIPAGSPKGGQGSNTMLWLDSWLEGHVENTEQPNPGENTGEDTGTPELAAEMAADSCGFQTHRNTFSIT